MIKGIYTYTFLGLMLLLASCSQDDVGGVRVGTEGGQIEFRTSLPGITTRATEVKESTLDRFWVSCFTIGSFSITPYFMYKSFSRSETGKFTSSDSECVWPNNNDRLMFVAFSPSCEHMRQVVGFGADTFTIPSLTPGNPLESDNYTLSGFQVARDIASHFDFVTAIGSGCLLDDEDEGVNLDFHHQLSRIELKAWNASTSYSLEIAGIRFGCIGVGGDFSFIKAAEVTSDASDVGSWTYITKGNVEYIFRDSDRVLTLDKDTHSSKTDAAYILRASTSGEAIKDNSAMLIPTKNSKWDHINNPENVEADGKSAGMYFSVLLRVTDTNNLLYPYSDDAEGKNVIYLAVDADNKVMMRLYKHEDKYYIDADYVNEYDLGLNNAEAKAFGWAALPVADAWKAGYVYTYTLNYTTGVGLRDPNDPNPGTPIISDGVGINVEINPWQQAQNTNVTVPRK